MGMAAAMPGARIRIHDSRLSRVETGVGCVTLTLRSLRRDGIVHSTDYCHCTYCALVISFTHYTLVFTVSTVESRRLRKLSQTTLTVTRHATHATHGNSEQNIKNKYET